MRTILITGANGFIGRNLVAALEADDSINVLRYNRDNTEDDLHNYLSQADFIFHIAGVNRPKHERDFEVDNVELTLQITNTLETMGKHTPIVYPSSIHAVSDTSYGISKKQSENILFSYAERTGANVYLFRLCGTFGKWGRPEYNSVVATWCYNIAHDLPIQVNSPEHVISLIYIDDVVSMFISIMNNPSDVPVGRFGFVFGAFRISLGELASTIKSFRSIRDTAVLPDMKNLLTKYLYSTYLSYLESDNLSYPADMKTDERGWLFELIKSPNMGQIFVSQTKPGITRGGHYHNTKVEKFVVVQGTAVIRLRRIDGGEIIESTVSDGQIEIVDIPPGYTHDITNIGDNDVITLFWACEIFDPESPDTYYLKV